MYMLLAVLIQNIYGLMYYLKISSSVQHPRVGSGVSKKTEEHKMQKNVTYKYVINISILIRQ